MGHEMGQQQLIVIEVKAGLRVNSTYLHVGDAICGVCDRGLAVDGEVGSDPLTFHLQLSGSMLDAGNGRERLDLAHIDLAVSAEDPLRVGEVGQRGGGVEDGRTGL